jgi:undecaprenyl-phosphate 4-deoxy-4-formamido-L-arabinose transferase
MKISICIPVFNSENTIAPLVSAIETALYGYEFEIILVNDGSSDLSEKVCEDLAKKNPKVGFISLAKNFGEHNAVMCALNYISGDCAVIVDDDFQNPPSEIERLVDELSIGYDVVYSKYVVKRHHVFRNIGSKFNDLVSTWLLGKPKNLYLSSFKAIRRETVDEIIKYTGPFPYIDGLILRATNSISSINIEHASRQAGQSNYTFGKLVSLWLNMFINFSIKPLRLFAIFGLVISLISLCMIIILIIHRLSTPDEQVGWTSVIVTITFFAGLQTMFLGLVAEYLGKNYLTMNQTPQWVIRKKTF